jgi:hypothetical protein
MKDEGGRMKARLCEMNDSTGVASLSSFILPPSSLLFMAGEGFEPSTSSL